MEYLNDALWKAARFPLNSKIINPLDGKSSTILDQILEMKKYVKDSLIFFDNLHVNKQIDYILDKGTEYDNQIKIFNQFGMQALKKFLIEDIEYNN